MCRPRLREEQKNKKKWTNQTNLPTNEHLGRERITVELEFYCCLKSWLTYKYWFSGQNIHFGKYSICISPVRKINLDFHLVFSNNNNNNKLTYSCFVAITLRYALKVYVTKTPGLVQWTFRVLTSTLLISLSSLFVECLICLSSALFLFSISCVISYFIYITIETSHRVYSESYGLSDNEF